MCPSVKRLFAYSVSRRPRSRAERGTAAPAGSSTRGCRIPRAAGPVVASLPRPQLAAGEAQAGRALQRRARRRGGLEHEAGHGGGPQRLVVETGLALEARELASAKAAASHASAQLEAMCVFHRGPPVGPGATQYISCTGRVPGDQDGQRAGGARGEAEPQPQRRRVRAARPGRLGGHGLVELPGRCLAPEVRERVEPSPAHPVREPRHAAVGGDERQDPASGESAGWRGLVKPIPRMSPSSRYSFSPPRLGVPGQFVRFAKSVHANDRRVGFSIVHWKMAQGIDESRSFSGMNGFHAVSEARSGSVVVRQREVRERVVCRERAPRAVRA